MTTTQVAAESEATASDGSVFDVVHEFKRLHSTTWKLMTVDFAHTARLNVDLVSFTFMFIYSSEITRRTINCINSDYRYVVLKAVQQNYD